MIKDIQIALTNRGYDTKGIDGIAGKDTYAAVLAFQKAKGLKADGVLRWETLFALFPDYAWSPILNERASQIASFLVGVREERGPNEGIMVNAFQKDVGIDPGSSWCMAMDYWVYDEAAHSLGIKNPLVPTGGCLDQLNRTTCRVIPAAEYTDPQPGDMGIIDLGKGHGHTYLVLKGDGVGVVDSVEGNTNIDGSSNGNGQYFRQRIISHTKAYIRP